ncbi:hypothetical protein A2U01_0059759, partial [Trifolium medium]|nr:hypothetical protein [Trifolium medium]
GDHPTGYCPPSNEEVNYMENQKRQGQDQGNKETIQVMAMGGDKMINHPTDNTNMKITTSILLNKVGIQS